MTSVQSGSVYNKSPTSAELPNRASPAGSVHLPCGMLQPFANAQQLAHTQQTQAWSSPAAAHDPTASPVNPFAPVGHPTAAPGTGRMPATPSPGQQLLQDRPASRVHSPGRSSQPGSIPNAAPEFLAGPPQAGAHSMPPGEVHVLPSLAASVVDHMPLYVRPTSTQEGTETPVVPSDDDTIEMRAGVSDLRGRGASYRGRRAGSSIGGAAAAAPARRAVPDPEPAAPTPAPDAPEPPVSQQPLPAASPPPQHERRHSCSADESPDLPRPKPPDVPVAAPASPAPACGSPSENTPTRRTRRQPARGQSTGGTNALRGGLPHAAAGARRPPRPPHSMTSPPNTAAVAGPSDAPSRPASMPAAVAHSPAGSPAASAAANADVPAAGARQRAAVRSISASAAVSVSAAVSPAPGMCLEEQKSSTGTADRHHRAEQAGAASRIDQSPVRELGVLRAAEHQAVVVDQAPEPQPAACTVPLQPPTSMPSRERGGSVSSWPPPAGATAQKHAPAPPEGVGEVQDGGGSNGRECSVEQRRTRRRVNNGEVQGGGGAGGPAAALVGNGMDQAGGGGRADAIIGDGIVGGATDDLEYKMSVEIGMEVEGGGPMVGEVVQGEAGDEEEEVPSKPKDGAAVIAEEGGGVAGPAGGGAEQMADAVAEAGGDARDAEMAPRPAAAVSATVGVAGGSRDGAAWQRGAPGSPGVSESGSGNAGVRDAWDNESEAFQGSAGVVEGVERNDSAAGEVGAPEVQAEGVGEISVEARGARHEGAGEIGGAASRAASHVRGDSMIEGSGFHVNSPIFGAPQESAEGNAASHAAASVPGSGMAGAAGGGERPLGQRRAGESAAVGVPQVEGQGEIAGPTLAQWRTVSQVAAAEAALAAHMSRADRSGEGEVGLSEGAGEVGGGMRAAMAWDAAGAGTARAARGEEMAVESALNAAGAAMSVPSRSAWVTPIGSRTGEEKAAAVAFTPQGEGGSEGGPHSGRAGAWNLATTPMIQHQASGNLGAQRAASCGGVSAAATAAVAAMPRPALPQTLSRAASAEDVVAGSSGGAAGRGGLVTPLPAVSAVAGQAAHGVPRSLRRELMSQRSVYAELIEAPPQPWLVSAAAVAAGPGHDVGLPALVPAPGAHLAGAHGSSLEHAHLSILQSIAPELVAAQDVSRASPLQPTMHEHSGLTRPGTSMPGRHDASSPALTASGAGSPGGPPGQPCPQAQPPPAALYDPSTALLSLVTAANLNIGSAAVPGGAAAVLFPEALAHFQACSALPALSTVGAPPLLSQLPHHLQSWLQDLCRTDPRGLQLLQALSAVHNPAVPGLHTVAQRGLPPPAAAPHVLASPCLPPLCPTEPPASQASPAALRSTPPRAKGAAAAAEASPPAAAQPRKRGKRTRGGSAAASPAASAATDACAPSRITKRTRLSPLGSPITPAQPAPSSAARPTQPAAPPDTAAAVAKDLMALLSHRLPHGTAAAGHIAQHALYDAAASEHGAAAAALAGMPVAGPPHCLGAFTTVPRCGDAAPLRPGSAPAATADPRSSPQRHGHAQPHGHAVSLFDPGMNGGEVAGLYQPGGPGTAAVAAVSAGAPQVSAAVAGSAPLSPEQRAELAQRLEAVFGGMGMDSATISAGLAIALGLDAGRGIGH
eukprot:jgi/Ulvmu1/8766/UM048_0021.1